MAADYTYLGINADLYGNTSPALTDALYPQITTNTGVDSLFQDASISNSQVDTISANKITTGTLAAGESISVGTNSLIFDGTNRSIYVSDGTYTVIHIGKAVGFY